MPQIEIRIEGHLDKVWRDFMDGLTVVHAGTNETLVIGFVKDQAALYGLIAKLRDLGVRLISVHYMGKPAVEDSL